MIEYSICQAFSAPELWSFVIKQIEQGWKPLGGVSVTSCVYHDDFGNEKVELLFVQAMTRGDDNA